MALEISVSASSYFFWSWRQVARLVYVFSVLGCVGPKVFSRPSNPPLYSYSALPRLLWSFIVKARFALLLSVS
jgi:hypothetical protein